MLSASRYVRCRASAAGSSRTSAVKYRTATIWSLGRKRRPDVGLIAAVKMLCDLTRRNAHLTPHSWDVGYLSLQRAKVRVIERQCPGFARQSHLKLLSQVKCSDTQSPEEPGICHVSRRRAPCIHGYDNICTVSTLSRIYGNSVFWSTSRASLSATAPESAHMQGAGRKTASCGPETRRLHNLGRAAWPVSPRP